MTREKLNMRGRPFQTLTSPIVEGEVAGAVLLDAQLRLARLRGVKVSERMAAKWAAAAIRERFEIVSDLTFAGAPPLEPTASGRRRSPTTKALSNGYREFKLMDRKNPAQNFILTPSPTASEKGEGRCFDVRRLRSCCSPRQPISLTRSAK